MAGDRAGEPRLGDELVHGVHTGDGERSRLGLVGRVLGLRGHGVVVGRDGDRVPPVLGSGGVLEVEGLGRTGDVGDPVDARPAARARESGHDRVGGEDGVEELEQIAAIGAGGDRAGGGRARHLDRHVPASPAARIARRALHETALVDEGLGPHLVLGTLRALFAPLDTGQDALHVEGAVPVGVTSRDVDVVRQVGRPSGDRGGVRVEGVIGRRRGPDDRLVDARRAVHEVGERPALVDDLGIGGDRGVVAGEAHLVVREAPRHLDEAVRLLHGHLSTLTEEHASHPRRQHRGDQEKDDREDADRDDHLDEAEAFVPREPARTD